MWATWYYHSEGATGQRLASPKSFRLKNNRYLCEGWAVIFVLDSIDAKWYYNNEGATGQRLSSRLLVKNNRQAVESIGRLFFIALK